MATSGCSHTRPTVAPQSSASSSSSSYTSWYWYWCWWRRWCREWSWSIGRVALLLGCVMDARLRGAGRLLFSRRGVGARRHALWRDAHLRRPVCAASRGIHASALLTRPSTRHVRIAQMRLALGRPAAVHMRSWGDTGGAPHMQLSAIGVRRRQRGRRVEHEGLGRRGSRGGGAQRRSSRSPEPSRSRLRARARRANHHRHGRTRAWTDPAHARQSHAAARGVHYATRRRRPPHGRRTAGGCRPLPQGCLRSTVQHPATRRHNRK
jgi:hypothetical protein